MTKPQSQGQSPPTTGKVRPITRWGTPILHREMKLVTTFDQSLSALVADMFATMYAAQGNGLAANQINVDLKVFVYDVANTNGTRRWGVVCNPVVETKQQRKGDVDVTQIHAEGCLSYPGVMAPVCRPSAITVRGVDQYGSPLEVKATGLLATVLQHETDHLNGTVYGDHVKSQAPPMRRKMDERFQESEGKGTFPEDWPVSKAKNMQRWVDCSI